jgi:hypothetical protein
MDLRAWLAYQPRQAQQMLLGDIPTFLSRFNPAILLLLVTSVVTYFAWPRTRYFGNTGPLIAAAALLYLSLTTPMALTASIWALPFVFVFIGGIWADLLETRRRNWALAALLLLLCENAWFCFAMVRHAAA